jgi:hypothetical protein
MTRPIVQIHDASSGENVIREMNDAEYEQWQAAKPIRDAEQAKAVREQRNQKLKDTDWTVIKALESNTPQNFDMAAYRQALRDITSQAGFPWDVQWPTQPE